MILVNSWPVTSGSDAAQRFFGPFIDIYSNWYVLEFVKDYPSLESSTYYIHKSTNSGSTWSSIANRTITSTSGSDYGTWDIMEVQQNSNIFVMVAGYRHIDWSDSFVQTQSWKMNNVDTWGSSVNSFATGNNTYYEGYIDNPVSLTILNNNNYVVLYNVRSGAYIRPSFMKSVDDTLTYYHDPMVSVPYTNFNYTMLGTARTQDDGVVFFWKHTDSGGTNTFTCWRISDSSINLTSGSGISTFFRNPQAMHGPIAPTTIGFNEAYAYVNAADGYLYTLTSGSFFEENIPHSTNKEYSYYSTTASGSGTSLPDWIAIIRPTKHYLTNELIGVQIIYKFRNTIVDFEKYLSISSGSAPGIVHRTYVGYDKKIYAWIKDGSYYKLYYVTDFVDFDQVLDSTVSFISSITSGSVASRSLTAQTISDNYYEEWSSSNDNNIDLYSYIDETDASDTDWIQRVVTSGSTSYYRAKITPLDKPITGNRVYIKYRYWAGDTEAYYSSPSMRVRLVQINDSGYINYATPYFGAAASASSTKANSPQPSALIDDENMTSHECDPVSCPVSSNLCWKVVDLGTARTINYVHVGTQIHGMEGEAKTYAYSYTISSSDNGVDYTARVSNRVFPSRPNEIVQQVEDIVAISPSVSARFWKINVVNGLANTGGWCLYKFELRGGSTARTVIAEWEHGMVGTMPETVTKELTTAEMQSVSDWKKLYLEFEQVDG